jgi:hypothetical protein
MEKDFKQVNVRIKKAREKNMTRELLNFNNIPTATQI